MSQTNDDVRMSQALATAPRAQRAAVARHLGINAGATDALLWELARPARIRETWEKLVPEARELLADAAANELHASIMHQDPHGVSLVRMGLVFLHKLSRNETRVVVPIEVSAALCVQLGPYSVPTAAWLHEREDEDLAGLEQMAAVEPPEATPTDVYTYPDTFPLDDDDAHDDARVARCIRLAAALRDRERVMRLLDTLSAAGRGLLLRLAREPQAHRGVVLRAHAATLAARTGEEAAIGVDLLVMLGLLHPAPGERYVVPYDLASVIESILHAHMVEDAHDAWLRLVRGGHPAMREVFARGVGGDPLRVTRERILRMRSHPRDLSHPIDRMLDAFHLVDEQGVPTPGGWRVADADGPEGLSRELLLSWISDNDDPWTRALAAAFDADIDVLARLSDDPTSAFRERLVGWRAMLRATRSWLLLGLSVAPVGVWMQTSHLHAFWQACFRISRWWLPSPLEHAVGDEIPPAPDPDPHGWPPEDVYTQIADVVTGRSWMNVLPVHADDMTEDHAQRCAEAVEKLLHEVFLPLGIVTLSSSGTLFAVNVEALRIFHPEADLTGPTWQIAEGILAEDYDYWLPRPTRTGPRITGVAAMRWLDHERLWIDEAVHAFDLWRLAGWSTVEATHNGWIATFDTAHIEAGHERDGDPPPQSTPILQDPEGNDAESFLLWLVARTQTDVPDLVRARFDCHAPSLDATPAYRHAAIEAVIEDALNNYHQAMPPPYTVPLLRVRSWGNEAKAVLLRTLKTRMQSPWELDEIEPSIRLLGELGVLESIPTLMRMLIGPSDANLGSMAAGALARLGQPAIQPLLDVLTRPSEEPQPRDLASAALTSLAVMHPHLMPEIVQRVSTFLLNSGEEPEDLIGIAVRLAETGHEIAEQTLHTLKDRGAWSDDIMPFDEALWIVSLSPCCHGVAGTSEPITSRYAGDLGLLDPQVLDAWFQPEGSGEDDDDEGGHGGHGGEDES